MRIKSVATILSACLLIFLSACTVPTESDSEIAKYTEIIKKDPNNAKAYHDRGKVYFKKKSYKKAVDDFKKALGRDSEMLEALYERACVYIELEEWSRAMSDINRYLDDPSNERSFKALERRAYIHLRKGDYNKAIRDCNRAMKLNPAYLPAITTKGKAQKARANQ